MPFFRVDISPVGKMVKITNFAEIVENSVKVKRSVYPHASAPSQLFGIRYPLAPKVFIPQQAYADERAW